MRELTPENAVDYLYATGRFAPSVPLSVRELSGGVSNAVFLVDVAGRPSFVLKQCRERLRVAVEWRARLDRIWVEHAVLRILGELLPPGAVPSLLFEDRDEYLFAMTRAPEDSETWKARLLGGDADPAVAARLGDLLATIHADAPGHPALDPTLSDTSLFDELRIDPYYRATARAHPRLASRFDDLIAGMDLPPECRALVLGDFSPKNILVHAEGLVLLDFECAHLGDPGFDLGFFMSHLALKRIHGAIDDRGFHALADGFLGAYLDRLGDRLGSLDEVSARGIAHAAACLLARVDGKSPVEYLDARGREVARRSALALFDAAADDWAAMTRVLDAEAKARG